MKRHADSEVVELLLPTHAAPQVELVDALVHGSRVLLLSPQVLSCRADVWDLGHKPGGGLTRNWEPTDDRTFSFLDILTTGFDVLYMLDRLVSENSGSA